MNRKWMRAVTILQAAWLSKNNTYEDRITRTNYKNRRFLKTFQGWGPRIEDVTVKYILWKRRKQCSKKLKRKVKVWKEATILQQIFEMEGETIYLRRMLFDALPCTWRLRLRWPVLADPAVEPPTGWRGSSPCHCSAPCITEGIDPPPYDHIREQDYMYMYNIMCRVRE